jgi:hypothetical protein
VNCLGCSALGPLTIFPHIDNALGLAANLALASSSLSSLTRVFASSTRRKNPGECCMTRNLRTHELGVKCFQSARTQDGTTRIGAILQLTTGPSLT